MFYDNTNIALCPFYSCYINKIGRCTLGGVSITSNCASNILSFTSSGTISFTTSDINYNRCC